MPSIRLYRSLPLVVLLQLAAAPVGATARTAELCPPIPDPRRSVLLNGVNVAAPASPAERASVSEELESQGPERRRAIVALALAGDLRLFKRLLRERDAQGLFLYAINYVNDRSSSCLARKIEEAVVRNLDDPDLRRALLAFFSKNLYRSRSRWPVWERRPWPSRS